MLNDPASSQQSGLKISVVTDNGSAYGFQDIARPSAISSDYTRYEVKNGDTPSQIAEARLGNYRRWTEILQSDGSIITPEESRRIQVKEVLWLPPINAKIPPAIPQNITIVDSSLNPITNVLSTIPEGYRKYIVQQGDTPSGIAESQLGNWRTWTEILQADRTAVTLEEARRLQVGEELWIPTQTSSEDNLTAALTATVQLSTEFYEYSIQPKDTRASIADKLWGDSSLANLIIDKAGNLLTSDSSLKAGDKVIIPVSTLPANILIGVGIGLPIGQISLVINRALLSQKIEQVVKYVPAIQKIANDFFSRPEIRGKISNAIGFKAESQISKALEDAGYKIFEVTPYIKNKGIDAIVMAPNGQIEFFEYKTTSKSGKAAEIEKLLPKDTKGLKQASLEWIVDRARRTLPKNNDPVVRQILADAIQKPQSITYKGVVVEKGTQAVRIFERKPYSSNFVETTTPLTSSIGLKQTNSTVDDLAKSIQKNVFASSDDLVEGAAKGASKLSKASKVLGPIGTLAGLALDAWTLKSAYDADGDKYGETFKTEASGVAGSLAGATSGAAFGATVGSFIAPGVGTVVGGIVGGVIGGIGGTDIGKDAYKSGVFKWWW